METIELATHPTRPAPMVLEVCPRTHLMLNGAGRGSQTEAMCHWRLTPYVMQACGRDGVAQWGAMHRELV